MDGVPAIRRVPASPGLVAGPGGPGVELEAFELELYGHRVLLRTAGTGPAVVLIHGMVNSSRHWEPVASQLAADYRVIVPDLLGHGDSAKPAGDYSLGAHAAGIRDLLSSLGVDRATIVGHSYGGGIAMQFFYQFPERCERMALVSSGGLGREVSLPLRAVALPGAGPAIAAAANRGVLGAIEWVADRIEPHSRRAAGSARIYVRGMRPLAGRGARRAFLHTLRSVIGPGGQRVSARDRLYLAGALPTQIAWGDRDHTIPVRHGREAAEMIAGARFATVPRAGHFPHIENPDAVAEILREFMETTSPARIDPARWRELIFGT